MCTPYFVRTVSAAADEEGDPPSIWENVNQTRRGTRGLNHFSNRVAVSSFEQRSDDPGGHCSSGPSNSPVQLSAPTIEGTISDPFSGMGESRRDPVCSLGGFDGWSCGVRADGMGT